MTTQETEVSTLLKLASDRSLIGRELVVEEQGTTQRGPISEITIMRGNSLHITVDWLAIENYRERTWELSHDEPFTYSGMDGWASAYDKMDGSIRIVVPMCWSGSILPAPHPRLTKPTA